MFVIKQPGDMFICCRCSPWNFMDSRAHCAMCRLLPVFTPGRAMMWGTILAMWGTGALVMSSSRALGIGRVRLFAPCIVLSLQEAKGPEGIHTA